MAQTETPGTEVAPRTRLRWWTELPLILLVYGCYTAGRLLARGDVSSAVDHGLAILRFEQALHLDAEHPLNRLFTREPWLGVPADFWYASLHYVVTPAVLVWLFRVRAEHYRAARTWLMTSTFFGLIGFTLLPTCPPRLLSAGHGFVDTMAHYSSYGWWGGEASAPRGMGGMTNQYAAMPSLHVGWALWCGIMLWRFGGTRLTKVGAVAYPLLTALVVMGTANHYFLDAVAGVAVMGVGLLLAPRVMRVADLLRARLVTAAAPAPADAVSPIVSDGCQTSAGERIPRQRESRLASAAEPDAAPRDAGDGTPAPAR
ncbi:phosphatase PAP2 family protein [Streptomyces collinus]|uniref:Integral membrane protein n=1 Tax=Streptomyces collinus (strain DSM 40733 / Tue 365) TaxID=1214242 RepID=S5VN33_STRC3|nr:phosphatase PAP2 family protein [Streptomyces collinus]AGS69780.1 integral membrane protein [Streptomyces collinus Tu 365]UJA08421.1 phosphatase PAP2 family protein [Streptomyces collinus]UJA16714.1 phosphatase PAP2 family protein [Streptomyces collinus]